MWIQWWSSHATTQHRCTTRGPRTRRGDHLHGQTWATPKRQKHSKQAIACERDRAYFLWGSSPCLEWRVYTHNASPARRGGSPGRNAPPLGSPGSTGLGPLWCRTGRRRSPCYLWVIEGRQGRGTGEIWLLLCKPMRSASSHLMVLSSFHLVYNPRYQAGAER